MKFGIIRRNHHHRVAGDEHCAPETISDTENWLNWHGKLDNPNQSEDDCEGNDQSDVELGNVIEASERAAHRVVSAAPNVPELIRPTLRSMKQAKNGLITVSAMQTRRNNGNKKK